MKFKLGSYFISLAILLSLTGCAGSNIPPAKATTGRDPTVAEVPDAQETVRGENDPDIVTLELGSALHERNLTASEELPGKIIIPTTNLDAVPISAALQAVLAGTDISLAWDTSSFGDHLVTVMNLSGPLPQVVERVCAAAKIFCIYRHGSLELADHQTFVVPLPPMAKGVSSSGGSTGSSSSANSMIDAINQLISGKSQVDEQGGNVIYTADVEGQERVHQYLEQLRNGRAMVVLQLYIWEVTLNKDNAEGINWTQFNPGIFGPGYAKLALSSTAAAIAGTTTGTGSNFTDLSTTSGGFSIGAITTGHLKTNSVISFLSTQGRLQTISSPQITFISGASAELKIGGTKRYISQVGTNTANVSGTTTNNTATNTVSTDSIDTGLTVSVQGNYENGVVFANLNLSLKNLVGLNPTNAGSGQTVDLPETTDEKINTSIRVRPGDNLVMAGLVTSADTNSSDAIPFLGTRLPTYGDDSLQNHELVILVKPSIVLFSDKNQGSPTASPKMHADATFIDKDGAKSVALPDGLTTPSLAGEIPASNGVDRSFMQHGFSQAFEQLNRAPRTTVSDNGVLSQ